MAEYTIQQRLDALRKNQNKLAKELGNIAKGATMRAVQEAADNTPPTKDDLSGTNTRTGSMKRAWARDSKVEPMGGALSGGGTFVTILANNMEYASYVNDGHRMDRHFVPGLVINEESGLLEFNPDGKGGIVVGTKTSYVEGLFMTDKAIKKWRETLDVEIDKLVRRLEE